MLQALLYDNDLASPAWVGTYSNIGDISISWGIHGGIQSYSHNITMSPISAWSFFKNYTGYRLTLVDQYCDRPIADGLIYQPSITNTGIHVACRGFWANHFDQYYVNTVTDADSTTDVIKDALTTNVPAVSSDQDNMDDTSTVIGFWEPADEGIFTGDLIQKLAVLSDGNNAQWNYWLLNAPFDGTTPQKPIPYFEAQVNDGTFDWQIWKKDLRKDSLVITRDISKLANDIQVLYTDSDGALQITSAATDSDSQSDYWTKELHSQLGDVPQTAAEQYRDLLLAKFKDALLRYQITITAPKIMDDNGAKWPLWTPIKNGGGYLQMRDIFPESTLFDESWDRLRTGQIMEMEYSSRDNSLRVTLDQSSEAADAVLARIQTFG
jgi:hypothetical protein